MTVGRCLLLALGCVLTLAACEAARSAALPAGPHVVDMVLDDYRFDYDLPVAGGRVLLRIHNAGSVPHSLTLLPLPEDIPPIDQQLRGTQRRAITPLAAVKAHPPGASTTLAVDLAPGRRYALVCFLTDEEGQSHALQGMNSEFRTVGRPGGEEPASSPS